MPDSGAASVSFAAPSARYSTFLHIQWAFALSCAYLLLFNEQAEGTLAGALLIVGLFLLNLILGRVGPDVVRRTAFSIGLAVVDIALVTACMYVADQLTVDVVLLCIGVLVMSVAGLRMGAIAVLTLVMMAIYLVSVWATGSETFLRSSVLLRVPLLLTSAFVFAWLVEAGSGAASRTADGTSPRGEMESKLDRQLAAIRRCEEAVLTGAAEDARAALAEITEYNRVIQMRARALLS